MPAFLVAPTEPVLLRALGKTSLLTERYGADVIWVEPKIGGLVGVQRKEYTDLLNSVDDGRLAKEVAQLTMVSAAFLVVEGRPHWTTEGTLNHKYLSHWTRDRWRSLLRDVQRRGITVEYTDDVVDTIAYVQSLATWLAKDEHMSLERRPKPGPDRWGSKTSAAFQRWVLQSVDGIGPKQAQLIMDAFGGVPLEWSVTEAELLKVKGLGPKKVAAMTRAISAKA